MIRFRQEELDGLVETLRGQPGFITAAIVPAGSGGALVERLRDELGDLEIEIANHRERAVDLGMQAAKLGHSRSGRVFVLRLDDPGHFDSEDDAIQFWRELNHQREVLGSGSVRTCLVLSEEAERGLALIADDLWDWTTIFRFPEAIRVAVHTPADSEDLIWSGQDDRPPPSESDLAILRSQWQRAHQAGFPQQDLVESYAVPLFLALPASHNGEAIQLWDSDLRRGEAVKRLPPEIALLVARKMMHLATQRGFESEREELTEGALASVDDAVATLDRKAAASPEAFEPGLAAALSASAKLYQDAGRYEAALSQIERCLDLLQRLVTDETEAVVEAHEKRRWALIFLLRSRGSPELPLLEQIESLQETRDSHLDDDLRSKALGAALEISIDQPSDQPPGAKAALFAAWLLSDDSHLEGPRFEDVLARDPVGYCLGLEALWQRTTRSPWKQLVIEPLIREWASGGSVSAAIRQQLAGWLLHFWDYPVDWEHLSTDDEKRIRPWAELQWLAIKILGYRYEPDLLPVFCRYVASFSASFSDSHFYSRHLAVHVLGFMLRWSYQERSLKPLQEVAADLDSSSAEREASRALANELWQVDLPGSLRTEPQPERRADEESFTDRLKRGQQGLLQRFSPQEFCTDVPQWGIAELAGDSEVPDLSREDHAALKAGLRALIGTGNVRDDGGQVTGENWIFDAWMPWLARGSEEDWWEILTELVERQIDLPAPQWALQQFPVLGIWQRDGAVARKIEEKLKLATGEEGQELRGHFGLLELLRWALHLEDTDALMRCLVLLTGLGHTTPLTSQSILWVMRWVLDRSTFEEAGKRRRAASKDSERRLWLLVEWPFVERLPPSEALAWCNEVTPLAVLWDESRWLLVDQLVRIADPEALNLLLGEGGVADPRDLETQEKILFRAIRRQELELLEKRHPEFIEGLTLAHRGTFLSQTGRTEELRQWGDEIVSRAPSVDRDTVFKHSRRALHHWARLEPEAFVAAAKEIVGSAEPGFHPQGLHEVILIVWQELEPLEAAKARAEFDTRFRFRFGWTQDGVPVHVHTLWDPEFSCRPAHRTLRLHWLRSCVSDKDIALHTFAANSNGMLPEVESIGKELLSIDRQLERALGVSLLAWHPHGDRWLEPLVDNDPSAWVRRHAAWAIAVCRRDRMGRRIYRDALTAKTWLGQQARFEQLVPLIQPTFLQWPMWYQELSEVATGLPPRRRALLIDFRYHMVNKLKWTRIAGRDLEKTCRGENVSTHLDMGEKGPPWPRSRLPNGAG